MNFKENLEEFLSEKQANELLDTLEESSKHAVLLNTKFISDEEFKKLFPNVTPHPLVKHAYLYNKDKYELGKSIYHELGYFYLQEPSAMVTASLFNFSKNDVVLDLCAAPGGKTVQMAFNLNGQGSIVSNDISKSRAEIISNNAERLGLENIIIINNDFEKIYNSYLNYFDKIMLDAPCSGSGMFRKNEQFINEWSINKVYKFQEIQKRLIEIAFLMLKPGGELIYSTCSYSKEENEDVINYLQSKFDFEIVKLGFGFETIGTRLMPSIFPGEGQYICKIIKPGKLKENSFDKNTGYKLSLPNNLKTCNIIRFNNTYFSSYFNIKTKGFSILRYGTKVGEENKNIFTYDLHYARTLKNKEFPRIELTFEECKKYLYGEVINKNNPYDGFVLLTYLNNPIDIAKSNKTIIKNYYPKGLRRKYN
ncbi:MAG: methyltransferase domain-containing protein [Bacilli bacterium]|nr:methyltransferase domain-containing protein [Bacilli bacterium]